MNVSGLAPNSLATLAALLKSSGSGAPSVFAPSQDQAKSAGSSCAQSSILPASGPVQLSLDALLSLQSADDPKPPEIKEMSAEDKFLAEAHKTPMQRMREQVLDALGLSEDALAQMTPDERRAAEARIRQLIEEKIRQATGADQQAPESNAAMLQTLL